MMSSSSSRDDTWQAAASAVSSSRESSRSSTSSFTEGRSSRPIGLTRRWRRYTSYILPLTAYILHLTSYIPLIYTHTACWSQTDGKLRGEFTLVLAPLPPEATAKRKAAALADTVAAAAAALEARLEAGEPLSRASKAVAAEHGIAKAKIYERGLRWQEERRGERKGRTKGGATEG